MAELPPDQTLEIFGQRPAAGIATPFLFCYRLPDPSAIHSIVGKLEAGLDKLVEAFPWMGGRVVEDTSDPSIPPVFKIRHLHQSPRVIIKDLRHLDGIPTMDELERREFPADSFDESFFSPFNVLPGIPEHNELRSHLLVTQANILRDGLVFTFMGHHQAMDGTGQEQLLYLLNKACRHETFTDEEVSTGNLDRSTIVVPFEDDWRPSEESRYVDSSSPRPPPHAPSSHVVPTERQKKATSPTSSIPKWVNIAFSGQALKVLKTTAQADLESGFVSTDDALSALIWRGLSKARIARTPTETISTMARAVDPRRYVNIPPTYPGYIPGMAYTALTLEEITRRSLGSIAAELRAAVDPESSRLSYQTKELATLLHRAVDRNPISITKGLDLDRDIMLSSWAGMRCYFYDFGLGLGLPVSFRRTKMGPVPSLIFFMPKREDGQVVVNLCAREDDLRLLEQDEEFVQYSKFVE
jgi:hypothetical protein